MKKTLFAGLATGVFLMGMAGMANAYLFYDSQFSSSGSGFGTQNNILTVHDNGNTADGIEIGKVAWNGLADVLSGDDVISGDGKTKTFTFGFLGITEASQIYFQWNPAETGGNLQNQVNFLKMTVYAIDGTNVFEDILDPSKSPVYHTDDNPGIGGQGFTYRLDENGALSLTSVLSTRDFTNFHIGLECNTSLIDDGPDTWTIGGNNAAPVPEPATMLLMGTGLAGLAASLRRKAKKN